MPPSPPKFDRLLQDSHVIENSSIMFEVDVSGYPEPDVEFFINNKKLVNNIDGIQIYNHNKNYKIKITNCLINTHNGEILAVAKNQYGQAECRANLTIEPVGKEPQSAPTFIKDLEDQVFFINKKVVYLKNIYLFLRLFYMAKMLYLKQLLVEIQIQLCIGLLIIKKLMKIVQV